MDGIIFIWLSALTVAVTVLVVMAFIGWRRRNGDDHEGENRP